MPVLPLALLLTVTSGAADRTIPPGCRDDYATCREDCSIDYGGAGASKYQQLTQCIAHCDHEKEACTTRFYTLRDTTGDMPEAESASPENEQFADPHRQTDFEDSGRRGVYRASEAETAPAVPQEKEEEFPARPRLAPAAPSAPPTPAAPPPPPARATPPPPAAPPTPAAPPPPPAAAEAEEPAADEPPPATVKKSAPAHARGRRQDIPVFGDADDTAAEQSSDSAKAPAAKKKKGASRRNSDEQ